MKSVDETWKKMVEKELSFYDDDAMIDVTQLKINLIANIVIGIARIVGLTFVVDNEEGDT